MDIAINYFAVLASGVVAMVLGALWYGPLFGKKWMALMGISKESMEKGDSPMKSYAIAFVAALGTAYVLAYFLYALGAASVGDALKYGALVWLGFVAVQHLDTVLWEGKAWTLFAINVSYRLVSVLSMALILTLWQ